MGGTGASSNSRPTEQEEKKQEEKDSKNDVYFSVMFSSVKLEDLVTYRSVPRGNRQVMSLAQMEKVEEEYGSTSRTEYDKSYFVDCSNGVFLIDELKDVEELAKDDTLITQLETAISELRAGMSAKLKKGEVTFHISIGCDTCVKDLGYALASICGMPLDSKIEDSRVKDVIKGGKDTFNGLKKRGGTVKFEYLVVMETTYRYITIPQQAS
jgi:hypothetical protein